MDDKIRMRGLLGTLKFLFYIYQPGISTRYTYVCCDIPGNNNNKTKAKENRKKSMIKNAK